MENIFITGATSEISKSLVTQLIAKGDYNLVLVSRKKQLKLDYPKNCKVIQIDGIDLSKEDSQKPLRDLANENFDSSFSIIHFAGDFWVHKPFVRTDFSVIRSMMESHYLTLCNVAQSLTPTMIKLGGGKLIAISCNSVGQNYPDMSPFTCAKAAVETFIKCYSNEYSEFNIASLALALPTIKTERVIREKPKGDHASYITPNEISTILIDILRQNIYVNGNVVKVFRHSKSYYNEGYFNRNPRELDIVTIDESINKLKQTSR